MVILVRHQYKTISLFITFFLIVHMQALSRGNLLPKPPCSCPSCSDTNITTTSSKNKRGSRQTRGRRQRDRVKQSLQGCSNQGAVSLVQLLRVLLLVQIIAQVCVCVFTCAHVFVFVCVLYVCRWSCFC